MKSILITLAASSIIIVGGCNKTKKTTANNAMSQPSATDVAVESDDSRQIEMEFNVEVESDGEQIVLMINGEERVIDLDNPMQWRHAGIDGDSNMEIRFIVNGEEIEGDFHALPMHVMRKIGEDGNLDIQVYMTSDNLGDIPEGIHEHVMQMMNEGGQLNFKGMFDDKDRGMLVFGDRIDLGEMRDHMGGMWVMKGPGGRGEMQGHRMMEMMGGQDHEDMMRMHDYMMEMMGDREMPEEMRNMHDRMMQLHEVQQRRPEHMRDGGRMLDKSEEHEFMQELGVMDEVSYRLSELGAISMLGIHMIREVLEPEERLGALERIIDEAPNPSPARNAALIVAIETLQEMSRDEDAADMMVELVLSNAEWDPED